MCGRKTHVRIVGRIQVLRGATGDRGEKEGGAIVAVCEEAGADTEKAYTLRILILTGGLPLKLQ